MNAQQLTALLHDALPRLESARDELRALDAAIGDGDLGITVATGAARIVSDLPIATAETTPAGILRQAAASFAAANPSTLSALVAGGLLAAAKALEGTQDIDRAAAVGLLSAATARIAQRGKADIGDKTILDAMQPSLTTLEQSSGDARGTLARMIESAALGTSETAQLVSRRGRAAWVGDRSIGHHDGGATAYVRLLEALQAGWKSVD